MARYKVLKAVAHNIAASFTSLMNYAQDDYVMGILLTRARTSGKESYFIDFASGQWSPVFDKEPLTKVAPFYVKMFWDNVAKQGSQRSMVKVGRLDVSFDTKIKRPAAAGQFEESPYTCTVSLIDDRGIDHSKTSTGWWFPEPSEPPSRLFGWANRLRSRLGV